MSRVCNISHPSKTDFLKTKRPTRSGARKCSPGHIRETEDIFRGTGTRLTKKYQMFIFSTRLQCSLLTSQIETKKVVHGCGRGISPSPAPGCHPLVAISRNAERGVLTTWSMKKIPGNRLFETKANANPHLSQRQIENPRTMVVRSVSWAKRGVRRPRIGGSARARGNWNCQPH